MSEHTTCQQPDRYAPRLTCGCPLPCPHHTFTIWKGKVLTPKDRIATRKQANRLKEIAEILT